MRAEILSIGTELLLGQITDTNAVYLAQRLAELGIPLYFEDTVGDNHERLASVLRLAKERSDLLICTGGLGPRKTTSPRQASPASLTRRWCCMTMPGRRWKHFFSGAGAL